MSPEVFSHAFYGKRLEGNELTETQVEIERWQGAEGIPQSEIREAIADFSATPAGKRLLVTLGFPNYAYEKGFRPIFCIVGEPIDNEVVNEGDILVGWGVMAFPDVCFHKTSAKVIRDKAEELEWYQWST